MAILQVITTHLQLRRWLALSILIAIIVGLVIASSAQAMGPGVIASSNKATSIARGKCRSRTVIVDFGLPITICDSYGADFCHIPRYNRQQVFCVGYFWLHNPYDNPKYQWEFWTRSMYFARNRYGKPQVVRPYYSWESDFPGYGPPDNAFRRAK